MKLAKDLRAESQGLASEPSSRKTPVQALVPCAIDKKKQNLFTKSFFFLISGEVSQPDGVVTTGSGKIEVVASKRQQKQAQAAIAMPPPPAKLSKHPAPRSSSFAAPAWAGVPPAGFYLEVQKNGEAVQQIELTGACTLFGRLSNAHVFHVA